MSEAMTAKEYWTEECYTDAIECCCGSTTRAGIDAGRRAHKWWPSCSPFGVVHPHWGILKLFGVETEAATYRRAVIALECRAPRPGGRPPHETHGTTSLSILLGLDHAGVAPPGTLEALEREAHVF